MSATLEALANILRRKRAAILRYVMDWGLAQTTEWTVAPSIPDCPHLVHMLVDHKLLQQVQAAADAHPGRSLLGCGRPCGGRRSKLPAQLACARDCRLLP
jgi:hypothetical protein